MLKIPCDQRHLSEAIDHIVRHTMEMNMIWDWP